MSYNDDSYNSASNKIYSNNDNENNTNRWSYTTNYDKKQFFFTMLLVSFAVLLEFVLLDRLSQLIYKMWENYFYYNFSEKSAFYNFFSSMEDDEFNNFISNISSIFIMLISFIAVYTVLLIFLRKVVVKTDMYIPNRISFKFKLPKNTWALLILGLAIVYFCGMISMVFDSFLSVFGIEKIYYDSFAFPKTAYGVALYIAALVITPAFLEEFFCRYLILNSLRKYGGVFAIITSAVFFGMLHGRTTAILYATAIGIYSAYIAVKTKSIWFSIILHAFINMMSIVWHYISELQFISDRELDIAYLLFSSAIYLFSFIYLIIIIKKKDKKIFAISAHKNYVYIKKSLKVLVFFNIVTIIFFCLSIYQAMGEYKITDIFSDFFDFQTLIFNLKL